MSFFGSMNISGSALTAQRLRMDVIAENIANAQTTRTQTGEPYRRKFVLMGERSSFASHLQAAGGGVRVTEIVEDTSPLTPVHDPTHPDADEDGYVYMPNVNTVTEMIDMMSATRSYEANITAINAFKNMAFKALEIGK